MVDNTEGWIRRADALLAKGPMDYAALSEAEQFATSMLTALYGPESTQLRAFSDGQKARIGYAFVNQWAYVQGVIKNAKTELESGLIVSLRVQVTGEVLGELVRLGKETPEDQSPEARNIAAVLVAAAFEALMRRMGEELAAVTGRPKLEEMVRLLKDAGVLKGGQIAVAQSFLKFRNDSLHADWNNVDRSQVQSCIAFVDALLVKHFS